MAVREPLSLSSQKVKVRPRTSLEALDGGGWLTPRPGRCTPGKETRYPLYGTLGGSQCRSGRLRKTLPPPEFDPCNVQPLSNRYTD